LRKIPSGIFFLLLFALLAILVILVIFVYLVIFVRRTRRATGATAAEIHHLLDNFAMFFEVYVTLFFIQSFVFFQEPSLPNDLFYQIGGGDDLSAFFLELLFEQIPHKTI